MKLWSKPPNYSASVGNGWKVSTIEYTNRITVTSIQSYAHLAPEQFRKLAMAVDELLSDTLLTQVANQEAGNVT